MSFIHSGIAMATLGLALLPLLIHLINRRRYRREPWAAMMFLVKAHRRSHRRIQLEQWLLLALRTCVIILIGWTIARPYARQPMGRGLFGAPHHDRVIVLDNSLSMQAHRPDGATVFDDAIKAALKIIDASSPEDGLAIVTASSPNRSWTNQPVYDPQIIRRIVESLRFNHCPKDIRAAVELASEVLSRGQAVPGSREVYIISDLSRAMLEQSLMGDGADVLGKQRRERLSEIDRFIFVNVGPAARRNLAIWNLRYVDQVLDKDLPIKLAFDVVNHSDQTIIQALVTLKLDGHPVRTVRLDPLPPDTVVTETVEIVVSTAGSHGISATMTSPVSEALTLDNTCYLALEMVDRIPVLLVEDRTDSEWSQQALFYCRVALNAQRRDGENSFFQVMTSTPDDLDDEILNDYSVVVMGDVGRLPESSWKKLARYVREGGGLVMIMGEHVQPMNYHRNARAEDQNAGLPPIRLDHFVHVGEGETAVRIELAEPHHPLLADFEGQDQGGLLLATVRSYWRLLSSPTSTPTQNDTVETLLRFSNGDPALLSTQIDKGRVLIWMTGLNMAYSNLPAKPDFMPLMLNLIVFAAGDRNVNRNILVGDHLIQPTTAMYADLPSTLTLPSEKKVRLLPSAKVNGLSVGYDDTDEPGFYRVNSADSTHLFAVNIHAGDSDLRAIGEVELKRQYGRNVAIVTNAEESIRQVASAEPQEFARITLYLLLAFVLMETVTATTSGPKR